MKIGPSAISALAAPAVGFCNVPCSAEPSESSMTPAERSNPALLNGSRKNRIAKGSGTSIVEVNRFLKQFEQMSKMMRMMTQRQFKPLKKRH